MAFGQASGPPAPQRRVAELAELLEARGFDSFKEARHPFGLTQRQAGGKFTTGEVGELIDRLGGGGGVGGAGSIIGRGGGRAQGRHQARQPVGIQTPGGDVGRYQGADFALLVAKQGPGAGALALVPMDGGGADPIGC